MWVGGEAVGRTAEGRRENGKGCRLRGCRQLEALSSPPWEETAWVAQNVLLRWVRP